MSNRSLIAVMLTQHTTGRVLETLELEAMEITFKAEEQFSKMYHGSRRIRGSEMVVWADSKEQARTLFDRFLSTTDLPEQLVNGPLLAYGGE